MLSVCATCLARDWRAADLVASMKFWLHPYGLELVEYWTMVPVCAIFYAHMGWSPVGSRPYMSVLNEGYDGES